MKKVIQIIPSVGYGDAVGNDCLAVAEALSGMGYETGVYARTVDGRVRNPLVRDFSRLPRLSGDDVVILNHCTGSDLCEKFKKMNGRKMMIYHNITPPRFFEGFSREMEQNLSEGYRQTRDLASVVEYCMPISEFNASDLTDMGYTCPMFIRPPLIPFGDYKKKPDKRITDKYGGGGFTNILFVGRIAPNKKQEDVIKAFAYYQRNVNERSRLFLVGNDKGLERYSLALKRYAVALGCENVVFTGHTRFEELLAYYKLADVFLCMSEHEGFCVPLAEAMFFDVPIIAYDSCAVPETLGGSGVLIKDKDPVFVSLMIDRLVGDKALRRRVIEGQRKRLKDFSYGIVKARLEEGVRAFADKV